MSQVIYLLLGDCRKRSQELREERGDGFLGAMIGDPPYEIAFMGRAWDDQRVAFEVSTWREVYQALEPGGIIKVFSATRTHHLLIVVLEHVGFIDIRLEPWVQGEGFPKGLNISKALDKMAGKDGETEREIQAYLKSQRKVLGLSKADVDRKVFGGTTRYSWVEGRGGSRANETYLPTPEEWEKLKGALELDDRFDDYIREVIPSREHRFLADGGKGDLVGETQGSYGYQKSGERWGGTQRDVRSLTEEAKRWEGYDVTLKPSWEPIIVARRPL